MALFVCDCTPTKKQGFWAVIDEILCQRLEMMWVPLVEYVGGLSWKASSLKSAQVMQRGHFLGIHAAEQIHKWN